MQVIKAGYEILDTLNGEEILKKIEKVARVCYKSEDKIGEGTAERMVRALIKSNHLAMLEHATLVVEFSRDEYVGLKYMVEGLSEKGLYNSFLRFTSIERYIVSGNLRAWREFLLLAVKEGFVLSRGLLDILRSKKYKVFFEDIALPYCSSFPYPVEVDPNTLDLAEKMIHADFTVKFIVDRGVSHEIVRHRVASFAQESTRYCNYGKSGDVTFIKPDALFDDFEDTTGKYDTWCRAMSRAEMDYLYLLGRGATPQEARAVLPNSLKTEVVMTANLREWRHFFSLRACGATGKPHPQMLEVAVPLLKELKERIPVVFDDLEPMEV